MLKTRKRAKIKSHRIKIFATSFLCLLLAFQLWEGWCYAIVGSRWQHSSQSTNSEIFPFLIFSCWIRKEVYSHLLDKIPISKETHFTKNSSGHLEFPFLRWLQTECQWLILNRAKINHALFLGHAHFQLTLIFIFIFLIQVLSLVICQFKKFIVMLWMHFLTE